MPPNVKMMGKINVAIVVFVLFVIQISTFIFTFQNFLKIFLEIGKKNGIIYPILLENNLNYDNYTKIFPLSILKLVTFDSPSNSSTIAKP